MADSKVLYSQLPSAYQELTYIQNTTTEYIDSGLLGTDMYGCEIELKANIYETNTNNYCLHGAFETGKSTQLGLVTTDENTVRVSVNFGFTETLSVTGIPRSAWTTIYVSDGLQKVNGQQVSTYNYGSNLNGLHFLIFARSEQNSTITVARYARVAYLWIKKNGEYIRNYIPAKRLSDNVCGLYDLVNDTFSPSLSGNFAGGEVVNPTWQHSLRKLSSATEQIASGQTIYANGQPITAYTIKGNTVQSGTPSPSNPITISGVGNKTANLLEYKRAGYNLGTNGYLVQTNDYDMWFAPVTAGQTYVAQNVSGTYGFYTSKPPERDPVTYDGSRVTFSGTQPVITVPQGVSYIGIRTVAGTTNAMLNAGSTVLPYEPLGYKIPISSTQTVNNYLGSIQSTRQIKKLVLDGTETWNEADGRVFISANYFPDSPILPSSPLYCTHFPNDNSGMINGGAWWLQTYGYTAVASDITTWKTWLQQQYNNGTPVIVYYVLATAETAAVNEPLMKIGDYADSISNATAIPTTEGANSITVDTTVQPSEFTATWTGWHDASVKEKSENLVSMSEPQGDGYIANTVLKENDTTATSNSFFVTEYIPVTGGATYYYYTRLYRSSTSYIVFYDSSKNYISEVLHKRVMEDEEFNLTSIAIPSNASYLRMCIDKQSTQNCLYTSQLPAYEPYWK